MSNVTDKALSSMNERQLRAHLRSVNNRLNKAQDEVTRLRDTARNRNKKVVDLQRELAAKSRSRGSVSQVVTGSGSPSLAHGTGTDWQSLLDEHFPGVTTVLGHKLGGDVGAVLGRPRPGSPRMGQQGGHSNAADDVSTMLADLQTELDEWQSKAEQYQKDNELLVEENRILRADLKKSAAQVRGMTKEHLASHDSMRQKLRRVEAENDELRASSREQVVTLEKRVNALRSKVTSLEVRLKDSQSKVTDLRASREELAEALIELDSETKTLRAQAPMRARDASKLRDAQALERQLNASADAVDQLRDTHEHELSSAHSRIAMLQEMVDEHNTRLERSGQESSSRVHSLQGELERLTGENKHLQAMTKDLQAQLVTAHAGQVRVVEDNWRLTSEIRHLTATLARKVGDLRALRAQLTELKVQSRFDFAKNAIETVVNESLAMSQYPGSIAMAGDINLAAVVSGAELAAEREANADLRALLREAEAVEDRLTHELQVSQRVVGERDEQLKHAFERIQELEKNRDLSRPTPSPLRPQTSPVARATKGDSSASKSSRTASGRPKVKSRPVSHTFAKK